MTDVIYRYMFFLLAIMKPGKKNLTFLLFVISEKLLSITGVDSKLALSITTKLQQRLKIKIFACCPSFM
jgi:hypothetical protein